jgi:hypothetical protein
MMQSLPRGFVFLGVLLMAAGALAQAPSSPKTAAEHNARGVSLYQNERYEEALDHFVEAYNLSNENEVVRRNLCNAYLAVANEMASVSDFRGAANHLEMAVNVANGSPMPLIQLGACYLRLNNVRSAIARLEEAVDIAPDNINAREMLGDAYYRAGDLPAALAQWSIAEEEEPNRKGLSEKIEKASREDSVEYSYNERGTRHFSVRYAPGTAPADLRYALTILERAYREIGLQLGGVYPPGPIQVIVYTHDDFSRATLLEDHVGAVYDGSIRLPIKDKSGTTLTKAEMKRRLYHEYTHVVVRHIVGDQVPWWLNEGLAETLSTDLRSDQVTALKDAYRRDRAFHIAELEAHQLKRLSPDKLRIAYLQAHAAVDHLWTRYGQRRMIDLLTLLVDGYAPEEALHVAHRKTYELIDRELRKRYGS